MSQSTETSPVTRLNCNVLCMYEQVKLSNLSHRRVRNHTPWCTQWRSGDFSAA